jgi:hypothetical protein
MRKLPRVQKFTRAALLAAGAILAIGVVALLAVNLYVQSHATQARIQHELQQRLGTTLHIRRISVTPWWGLKLTGITMPQEQPGATPDFLTAETFRLRVQWASLFARRLVIKEVLLVNPKVVWPQNADGKWRLPMRLPDELAPAPEVATAETSAPQEERDRFTPEVRRVYLRNGSFRFLDNRQRPVARFDGVRFRSEFREAAEVRGLATIARTSLRDRFFVEDLQAQLKYDANELELSEITARTGEGEVTGHFTVSPGETASPFKVLVQFTNVLADSILTDAGGPQGMVEGHLDGRLEATGNTADPQALNGTGEIVLRDGQLRQYSLLVALGQLLRIDELTQLRFDQAHVKFHITPGLVHIDELLLTSPNIRLSAVGTVDFEGQLRLTSQLAINDRIRSQLFRPVRDNFHPIGTPGFAAVDFQVSGTVERPRTNLLDQVVGPELRDLGGMLNNLFRGRSERRKQREQSAAEAAAAAEPAPAVVPVEATPPVDAVADPTPAPPEP